MHICKAIQVRYLGHTQTKPARFIATAHGGHRFIAPIRFSDFELERAVLARRLADSLGWQGEWHAGSMPDESFVFVKFSDNRDAANDYVTQWGFAIPSESRK